MLTVRSILSNNKKQTNFVIKLFLPEQQNNNQGTLNQNFWKNRCLHSSDDCSECTAKYDVAYNRNNRHNLRFLDMNYLPTAN